MSGRLMGEVFARSQHGGIELLMMLAIAEHANDDGGNAYPSVPSLATKCRTSVRYANRVLAVLRASGELKVQPNGGPHGTNVYRITLPLTYRSAPTPDLQTTPDPAASLTHRPPTPDLQVPDPLTYRPDEPSLNRQEPPKARRRAAPFDASRIDLPDWLPREVWADWVSDRALRRKSITERAAALQIKNLDELRRQGHAPKAVIEHCIANGYQGLFSPPAGRARDHSAGERVAARPALDNSEVFT